MQKVPGCLCWPARRREKQGTTFAAVLGILAALVPAGLAHAQCQYSITALIEAPGCAPPFDDPSPVIPTAINDLGVVTGYILPCGLGNPRPFIWSGEMGLVLIPLPEGVSDATPADINSNNEIVGAMNEYSSEARAFHWKDDTWTDLGLLPGANQSRATAINDIGDIVGESSNIFVGPISACIWRDETMEQLWLPVGPFSHASDINDSSTVIGWMGNGGVGDSVGFISNSGIITEIHPLAGSNRADPVAITENGVVTGVSLIPVKEGFIPRRSWIFQNATLSDLGNLPTVNHRTLASDINDAIQIIGIATNPPPDNSSAPFLWQYGTLYDLRLLIEPPEDSEYLQSAVSINNEGQIIGHGGPYGVVITPVGQPLGDVNFDCAVDERDLVDVLENWGPNKAGNPADVVSSTTFAPPSDGRVDAADLAAVLGNWSSR